MPRNTAELAHECGMVVSINANGRTQSTFEPSRVKDSPLPGSLLFELAWRRTMIWLPPLLYAAFIFRFSSESQPLPQLTASVWDKALHASEYAGLAFLLCRACRVEGASWPQALLFGLVLASVYAATDEWHQLFVPLRDANALDWLADTVGAAVGVTIMWLVSPLTERLDRHLVLPKPGDWGLGTRD